MLFKIFSGVAGAINIEESLFSFALYTASFIAIKLEIANMNGGSPTALDLFITSSLLNPRL